MTVTHYVFEERFCIFIIFEFMMETILAVAMKVAQETCYLARF